MRRWFAVALLAGLMAEAALLSGCSEHNASDSPQLACDQPAVVEAALADIRDELRVLLLQLAWIETDQPMPEAIIALDPYNPKPQSQVFSIAREQGASDALIEQTRDWLNGLSLAAIRAEQHDDIVTLVRCRALLQGLPTGEQPLGYSAYHDPKTKDVLIELIGL